MNAGIPFRNLLTLLIIFSALANLVLGALVLVDSPRRKINRLFSILCFTLITWSLGFIGLSFSAESSVLIFWSTLYAAGFAFVPPLFYHLILGSLGTPLKGEGPFLNGFFLRFRQLAYVINLGWVLFLIRDIFAPSAISVYPLSANPQFWFILSVYGLISVMALTLLSINLTRAKDPIQRNRFLFLLIGAATILVGGLITFVFAHQPKVHHVWLITFSHLLSTLCLISIAYALASNQIHQFTELFRKTIAFVIMTMILLTVFGGTHVLSTTLMAPYVPNSDFFALGVASILMALLFHPLRFRVQNFVDRIFFSKKYDQMKQLRSLSRRILSSSDREELLNILFLNLKEIGFGSISLLLKDPQKPNFYVKKTIGLEEYTEGFFLKSDSLLIQYLREEKEELIRDEVLRRIMADWERQALGEEMAVLDSEISFPLFSTRRRALFGLITLGSSDLGFSSFKGRNIFWLKSVIENAGIMLDNFYHYEFANALIPYVGKTWADEMRRNKDGFRERLSGHRTWVSILMVDIRHFTTMSSAMDAKEVVSLLKEFRSYITPVVYRYQGTIDKFIGDAIMIVFGLPILPGLENPDKNAVDCAMAISVEIEKMNEKRRREGKKNDISIGIGVSSGEVIAGNVNSGDRVEYTVIGDAANMVARLEDLAGDDQILLSPATYERVKNFVNVKRWEPRKIAGFKEALVVSELLLPHQKPPGAIPSSRSNPLASNQ